MAKTSGTPRNASRNDWITEYLEDIVQLTKDNVQVLCDTINEYRIDDETLQCLENKCAYAVTDFYKNLIGDISNYQRTLVGKTHKLLQKSSSLSKDLHIRKPKYERMVRERVQEYETLAAKQQEIKKLNTMEAQLCHALGRPTKAITISPLPSTDTIDEFKYYLADLEFDKVEHTKRSSNLRGLIFNLAKELNYKPILDFTKILARSDLEFLLTDINMERLNNIYKWLEKQVDDIREEISTLRKKVQQLWEGLKEDPKYSDEFMQKYTNNTLDTLQALKKEVNRCEALRRSNIEGFLNDSHMKLLKLLKHEILAKFNYGKPLLSRDKTIETIIFHDHNKHDEEKELSTQEMEIDKTITPGTSTQDLTLCSSEQNLACFTSNAGSLKRKIETPSHSTKHIRRLEENNNNVTAASSLSIQQEESIAKYLATIRRGALKRLSKEKDASSMHHSE